MTYTIQHEKNYAAEVVEVKTLIDLKGLDNLKGLPVGGHTALVSKDTQIGDHLLVFPAESQLSEQFAQDNNLFSNSELNADTTQTGYLGKNRRVRAIRLRGNLSSALAMSVNVLERYNPPGKKHAGAVPEPGTVFDTVNGVELCRKYELPVRPQTQAQSKQVKMWRRVEDKFLPEHFDTSAYWRSSDMLDDRDQITITQKLHGTSIRIGNTIVKRKLTKRDKIARLFGIPVQDHEHAIIGGSRKVIKDPDNSGQNHYYKDDIWTREALKYGPLLPKNVIVYGELIGWAGKDSPLQAGYTYDVPNGEAHLYVYRVVVISPDGTSFDLSWNGVKEFCTERGLKHVPELSHGEAHQLDVDNWLDRRYADLGYAQAVPLSGPKTVDEGVCIRREGVVPFVLKAKAPKFFEHETKLLDEEKEILS